MRRLPLHGRGAAGNPPNRFQSIEFEREAWTDFEDPGPETRFLRDRSRSVITTNASPDVPFEASLNPYRGCEHGCVYCLGSDTPILMADGFHRPIRELAIGDEIYGTRRVGSYRRLVKTRVLDRWTTRKPSYRVELSDGTVIVTSGDHRFLTWRGWKYVTGSCQGVHRRPHLTENDRLLGFGSFSPKRTADETYRRGYLCGMIRGDGHIGHYSYDRVDRGGSDQHQFRLALADEEALLRSKRYLSQLGVTTSEFEFQAATATRSRMSAIRTHARRAVSRIEEIIAWRVRPSESWSRGYLAGLFDAEGSFSQGILRLSNADRSILDQAVAAFHRLGFDAVEEPARGNGVPEIRLRGGLADHVRFFHTVRPAIPRKRDIGGAALKSRPTLRLVSVEPLGRTEILHDLTTGTGDFIADGVVSHNCYARPTHEYLGFSAGLDFESRILVKEDAPELLREELADPAWEPQTLALSGVTDPYQPVERRLEVTRRCLEVLVEARNPVGVVTKSRLVLRDRDLLAELAAHDAARVSVSITTLEEELRRVMEPRAPTARRRLQAVEGLAEAGVPVGVLIAPVIPGLNDEEVPALLEAAAAAGARHAGYVLLRLPHAVEELFVTWLEQHFPDRKEKVLGRIREARGGRLNDPRFGRRMSGEGPYARQLGDLFRVARRKHGLEGTRGALSSASFRRPAVDGAQIDLFAAAGG